MTSLNSSRQMSESQKGKMAEGNMKLHDWYDDLCVRFLMNNPKEDLETAERICFRVEEAQWFYEDFIRPLDPTLPSMSLKHFCEEIFAHCPLLSPFSEENRRKAFEAFLSYKKRIPVRGAIMLNAEMDQVVLVKGWRKGSNWGFPRGKINKDEDDLDCAIREVYEETGLDLAEAGFVPADRQVKSIELNLREQQIRLYVFRGIPLDTHFEPRTRKEISAINWLRLSELPAFRKKKAQSHQATIYKATDFYMVAPFLTHLRKWIVEQKNDVSTLPAKNSVQSSGSAAQNGILKEHEAEIKAQPHSYGNQTKNLSTKKSSFDETSASLNHTNMPQSAQLPQDQMESNSLDDTGPALLALLHKSNNNSDQCNPQDYHPKPLASHQARNVSYYSNLPPVPNVPNNEPSDEEPISYKQPSIKLQYSRMIQAQKHIQSRQRRSSNYVPHGPHPHQPQHLIHPQPLPPHVQRTVFVQSPVPLSPMVSNTMPNSEAALSMPPQNSTINAGKGSEGNKHGSIKLNNHTLALLNSFKNREVTNDEDTPETVSVQRCEQTPESQSSYANYPNLPAAPTPPLRSIFSQEEEASNAPSSEWNIMPKHVSQEDSRPEQQQELEMARRRAAREQGLLQESDHRILQDIWRQVSLKDHGNHPQNHMNPEPSRTWNHQRETISTPPLFDERDLINHKRSFQNSKVSPQVQPQQEYQQDHLSNSHRQGRRDNTQRSHNLQGTRVSQEFPERYHLTQNSENVGIPLISNGKQKISPDFYSPRHPPSEKQKTALLGLFRSSDANYVDSSKNYHAKVHTTTSTPPVVELAAAAPLCDNPDRSSMPINMKWNGENAGKFSATNAEANLPFRPMTILSRPPDTGNLPAFPPKEVAIQNLSAKISGDRGDRVSNGLRHKPSIKKSPQFQPQILKRHPSHLKLVEPYDLTSNRPKKLTESHKVDEYKYFQPVDHRQNLLSLFNKEAPIPPPHNQGNNNISVSLGPDMYPHFGAKPYPSENRTIRKGSQPISPENKGFLLSYLNAVVAKGVNC